MPRSEIVRGWTQTLSQADHLSVSSIASISTFQPRGSSTQSRNVALSIQRFSPVIPSSENIFARFRRSSTLVSAPAHPSSPLPPSDGIRPTSDRNSLPVAAPPAPFCLLSRPKSSSTLSSRRGRASSGRSNPPVALGQRTMDLFLGTAASRSHSPRPLIISSRPSQRSIASFFGSPSQVSHIIRQLILLTCPSHLPLHDRPHQHLSWPPFN